MTNLEAIIAEISIPGYNTGSVTKALLDAGIDPDGLYTAKNLGITNAALVVLRQMLGIKEIQEGGYQIVYDIKARISALEDQLGIGSRYVQNASWRW